MKPEILCFIDIKIKTKTKIVSYRQKIPLLRICLFFFQCFALIIDFYMVSCKNCGNYLIQKLCKLWGAHNIIIYIK